MKPIKHQGKTSRASRKPWAAGDYHALAADAHSRHTNLLRDIRSAKKSLEEKKLYPWYTDMTAEEKQIYDGEEMENIKGLEAQAESWKKAARAYTEDAERLETGEDE